MMFHYRHAQAIAARSWRIIVEICIRKREIGEATCGRWFIKRRIKRESGEKHTLSMPIPTIKRHVNPITVGVALPPHCLCLYTHRPRCSTTEHCKQKMYLDNVNIWLHKRRNAYSLDKGPLYVLRSCMSNYTQANMNKGANIKSDDYVNRKWH